jgi:hypothetical protein
MLTAEAHVETERPSRYLVQLCRHAGQMGGHRHRRPRIHGGGDAPPEVRHVEWSDSHGVVHLSLGQWTMRATENTLALRVDAADEEALRRMQELLAGRLETIGRRDQLTVTWQRPEVPTVPAGEAGGEAAASTGRSAAHRRRRSTIGLVVIGALAVAAHVLLGGAALEGLRWTSVPAGIVLVVVLVKLILLGVIAARRGKAAKSR